MKWYWRKQARKDVVSLNSVKYTLHDGLMKVAEPKPPAVQAIKIPQCEDDNTINNLTQSLKSAQKASNYWRGGSLSRNLWKNETDLRNFRNQSHSSSFKWVFLTKLIIARLHYPLLKLFAV